MKQEIDNNAMWAAFRQELALQGELHVVAAIDNALNNLGFTIGETSTIVPIPLKQREQKDCKTCGFRTLACEQKPVDVEYPNFFDDFRKSDVEVDSNEDGLIAETIRYKKEQKSVDKVKIEKDKWYICVRDLDDNYGTRAFCKGSTYYSTKDETLLPDNSNVPFEIKYCVNNYFRLWNIQDAKDGNVLATKAGGIFIYKELLYDKPFAYCGVDKFGVFKDCNCGDGLDWTPYLSDVTPATKEQCDVLMKAMADAGYTFDFEKKELKKIELRSYQWNISDFRTWQYIVSDVLTKHDGIGQYLDNGLCKKIAQDMQEEWSKKLCSVQHPAEWSEEDETTFTVIGSLILDNFSAEDASKTLTWLHSLRPNHWKPSDEQMEALESATENCAYSEYQDCLRELVGQLKKLREE